MGKQSLRLLRFQGKLGQNKKRSTSTGDVPSVHNGLMLMYEVLKSGQLHLIVRLTPTEQNIGRRPIRPHAYLFELL